MIIFEGRFIPIWLVFSTILASVIYVSLPSMEYEAPSELPILILLFIILFTLFLLWVLHRYPLLLKGLEYFILSLLGLYITNHPLGSLLPFLLLLHKNLTYSIAAAFSSALIASMMDVKAVLLLYTLLSIYDLIAVFVTKHMVDLVHKLGYRAGGDKPLLGGGDIIIPLSFSLKLLDFGIIPFLLSFFGHLIAILLLLWYVKREKVALPALPFTLTAQIVPLLFLLPYL